MKKLTEILLIVLVLFIYVKQGRIVATCNEEDPVDRNHVEVIDLKTGWGVYFVPGSSAQVLSPDLTEVLRKVGLPKCKK